MMVNVKHFLEGLLLPPPDGVFDADGVEGSG
jgi:hypothetical protein